MVPEDLPAEGGSYIRDPQSGALIATAGDVQETTDAVASDLSVSTDEISGGADSQSSAGNGSTKGNK